MKEYKGIIIGESLENPSVLEGVIIVSRREEPDQDNPDETWHLYDVSVSRDEIPLLQKALKQGWYMHFWKGRDVLVVFRDKTFELDYDDESTWEDAVDFGLSLGIPKEQLDFLID